MVINYLFLFSWLIHIISIMVMCRWVFSDHIQHRIFLYILIKYASCYHHFNAHMLPVMTTKCAVGVILIPFHFQPQSTATRYPDWQYCATYVFSALNITYFHVTSPGSYIQYHNLICSACHININAFGAQSLDLLMACCALLICTICQNHYCVMNKWARISLADIHYMSNSRRFTMDGLWPYSAGFTIWYLE